MSHPFDVDLLGPFGFALNAESVFFKAANLLTPSMHHKDIAEGENVQKKRVGSKKTTSI